MATDYTKDIDFIIKRIDEQIVYCFDINKGFNDNIISKERYLELDNSATKQLVYFYNLKSSYESKDKLPTIHE